MVRARSITRSAVLLAIVGAVALATALDASPAFAHDARGHDAGHGHDATRGHDDHRDRNHGHRGANVPIPLVTGPVTGPNAPFTVDNTSQLPAFGYVQQEYFLQGTARAFGKVGTWTADGEWRAAPSTTAAYKTRIIVRKPADPKKFNGTVFVEWNNVSAGFDTGPDWGFGRTELLREGFAYVGVSAQFAGVDGGGGVAGIGPLKTTDPARYGSLVHPGDSYSYDIFSQAGAALLDPRGVDPLAGLHVKRLVAAGESQSAFRMLTYVNAIDPLARVYDAFFIHSRFADAAPLFEGPGGDVPGPTRIRTDLRVPVLQFESETDVVRAFQARQPDNHLFRSWEVAGTSHADLYSVGAAAVSLLGCTVRINEGPEHYVVHTAIHELNEWAADHDHAPAHSPRIQLDANGDVVRDRFGNALGGIRTPQLDVPIATLSGINHETNSFCGLFGETTPFDAATLASLYPTHADYVAEFDHAADEARERGFLLRPDVEEMQAIAAAAPIPA